MSPRSYKYDFLPMHIRRVVIVSDDQDGNLNPSQALAYFTNEDMLDLSLISLEF